MHGVILAGGAARRMGGGDKPLARFGTGCLLDCVVAAVAPQVDALALSANGAPARFASWGLPVLADGVPGLGPLGGMLAGLRWAEAAGATQLLCVPGDAPFLPSDLAARLGGVSADIAHAVSAGRAHPVIAVVRVHLAADLSAWLADGGRTVLGWMARHGAVGVPWGVAGRDPFTNINTPAELADYGANQGASLAQ